MYKIILITLALVMASVHTEDCSCFARKWKKHDAVCEGTGLDMAGCVANSNCEWGSLDNAIDGKCAAAAKALAMASLQKEDCACFSKKWKKHEAVCEGTGLDMAGCGANSNCVWGGVDLANDGKCFAAARGRRLAEDCACFANAQEHEAVCEGTGLDMAGCGANSNCHWDGVDPANDGKCRAAAKGRRLWPSFGQVMGCLGSGACATALATECGLTGWETAGVGCVAGSALLASLGCTSAVQSCVGKRRVAQVPAVKSRRLGLPSMEQVMACASTYGCAVNPVGGVLAVLAGLPGNCVDQVKKCVFGRRRLAVKVPAIPQKRRLWPSFGQMMGCLGAGACGTALATECGLTAWETAGVGCVAGGAVAATFGCTDAVKSCVGKRAIRRESQVMNRRLGLPSMDQLMACANTAGCAVNPALGILGAIAGLPGNCVDQVKKCVFGRRRAVRSG